MSRAEVQFYPVVIIQEILPQVFLGEFNELQPHPVYRGQHAGQNK